ncbi:hypothetical protein [Niallia oryzisoli]|uniref:hypothetical protein n=1 Tax=Niallia oryzisoli TaxID=1737571 RepID=UPI003735AEBD
MSKGDKIIRNTIKRAEKDLANARKQQTYVFWICVILTIYLVFSLIAYHHILYLILIPVAWTAYFLKVGSDKWYRRIIEERKNKFKDHL